MIDSENSAQDNNQKNVDREPFQFGEKIKLNGASGFYYRGKFGTDKALVDNDKIFPPLIVPRSDISVDED